MAKAKKSVVKKTKEKKKKILKAKGYVISIKLRSTDRHGAKAYLDVVQHLYRNKIKKKIGLGGNDRMLIRTQTDKKIGSDSVLYGKFAKYTKLDGKDWIDEVDLSLSPVATPANKNPNPRELSYVFVPACHRFFIEKSSKVSYKAVVNYLKEALKDAIDKDEQIEVDIDLSKGVYKEIFDAKFVEWIEVGISYTNDDTNNAGAEIVDKQFKKARIGKARMLFSSDATKNIDVTEPYVKGVIDLSRTNGYAIARVKNKKYKTINTGDHPEEFIVERPEDQSWEDSIAKDLLENKKEEK